MMAGQGVFGIALTDQPGMNGNRAVLAANMDLGRQLVDGNRLADVVRWPRLVGLFGGWVKLGSGCYQAANFSVPVAQYASSGVRPASAECGRRAL